MHQLVTLAVATATLNKLVRKEFGSFNAFWRREPFIGASTAGRMLSSMPDKGEFLLHAYEMVQRNLGASYMHSKLRGMGDDGGPGSSGLRMVEWPIVVTFLGIAGV